MPWIDLKAVYERLKTEKQYAGVCIQIQQLWSLYAIQADLDFARGAITQLMKIGPSEDGHRQATSEAEAAIFDSLLVNAVISYCRAAVSDAASERFSMLGDRHLKGDRKAQHKLVVDLRNKVLAHHGYGEFHPETPWLRDALVFRVTETLIRVRGVYIRLNTSKDVMVALDSVTTAALAQCAELEVKFREVLSTTLLSLGRDEEFVATIKECVFDGPTFFGDQPGWDAATGDFIIKVGERTFSVKA